VKSEEWSLRSKLKQKFIRKIIEHQVSSLNFKYNFCFNFERKRPKKSKGGNEQ
jgi:hypothetical protein